MSQASDLSSLRGLGTIYFLLTSFNSLICPLRLRRLSQRECKVPGGLRRTARKVSWEAPDGLRRTARKGCSEIPGGLRRAASKGQMLQKSTLLRQGGSAQPGRFHISVLCQLRHGRHCLERFYDWKKFTENAAVMDVWQCSQCFWRPCLRCGVMGA